MGATWHGYPRTSTRARSAELLAKAACLYEVVYEHAIHASRSADDSGSLQHESSSSTNAGSTNAGSHGAARDATDSPASTAGEREYHVAFVWHVAGDFLLMLKRARVAHERDPELALFSRP